MQNQINQENIHKLMKIYELDPNHARQVCFLSLLIFDKTRGITHNLSNYERDLLEAGALLHDIGYSISSIQHNKHSYNLIMKYLESFSSDEAEIIANLARYHRGKSPQKNHYCFAKLADKKTKKIVKKLSSIIRIADGLDRQHISIVKDINCIYDSFSQILYFALSLTNSTEHITTILGAEKKKDLFENEFHVQVKFRID